MRSYVWTYCSDKSPRRLSSASVLRHAMARRSRLRGARVGAGMSGSLRQLRAGAQAIESTKRAAQLSYARTREGIVALRSIAPLWRRIAIPMPDERPALQAVEYRIEHAERQRMAVRLDLALDRQCISVSSPSSDRQHHVLFLRREHRRRPLVSDSKL